MTSGTGPVGPNSSGSNPSNNNSLPAEMMPTGPLLPADSPFVKACIQMFSNVGGGQNIEQMRAVATQLLKAVQQSIGYSINHEAQLSRERRQEDLRRLLGQD